MWAVIYTHQDETTIDLFSKEEEQKAYFYAAGILKQGYTVQILWAADMTNVPIGG